MKAMGDSKCRIALGSITHAMKAEELLNARMIPARVVREENKQLSRGCGYGVSVDCRHSTAAEKKLRDAGLPIRSP